VSQGSSELDGWSCPLGDRYVVDDTGDLPLLPKDEAVVAKCGTIANASEAADHRSTARFG
jgi:hypothetical protein